MVARLELPDWVTAAGLAGLCAIVGLIAGVDPSVAIVASLGLALIAITLANLTTGLILFVGITFLEFILPASSVLSFTKLAGLFLAVSWLARTATTGRREDLLLSVHPIAAFLLIGFLSWSTASVLWAESQVEALVDLTRYLLVFVLYVIVYTAVRNRRDAIRVIGVFIAGCGFTAAYALIFQPTTEENALRVVSTVGNPNVLASILVAGLALSLAAVFGLRNAPLGRLAAGAAAFLCIAGLFPTGSRSGAIALAAAAITGVLVAGRWRAQALIGTVGLAVVVTVAFAAFAPSEIRERIVQVTPGQQSSLEGRTTIWQVGGRMVADRPAQGVGIGNFQEASKHYVLEPGLSARTDLVIDDPQVAHNVYLQILAETGIVGLALFGGILCFSIVCALKAARRFERSGDQVMEVFARALVPAVVAILVSDIFASEQFNKLLWLLLGLGPALLGVALRSAEEQVGDQRP